MISTLQKSPTGRLLLVVIAVAFAFALGFASRNLAGVTVSDSAVRVVPALLIPVAPLVVQAATPAR